MEDKSQSSRSPEASGKAVQPLQNVLQASESEPSELLSFGFAYTLLCILGVVVLLGGVYGVFDAVMMYPALPATWKTEFVNNEVYDRGLMHRREITLLGSGIAVVAGILAAGFGITSHIGIRILRELQEIRDGG
jgi:hypothetical protein